MFRSSVPSRSAVQPSAASVIRASSSSARARHGLGELERERVRLALVQRRQRLAGEVPLVEEEERRARLAPADGRVHRSSSSIDDVDRGDRRARSRSRERRGDARLHRRASVRQHGAVTARRARARPCAAPSFDATRPARAAAAARARPSTCSAAATTRPASASPVIRIEPCGPSIVCPSWLMPAIASAGRRPSISARKLVEYSPLPNSGERRMSSASARVVGTPSSSISSSARTPRAIAAGRSSAQTISFAISES